MNNILDKDLLLNTDFLYNRDKSNLNYIDLNKKILLLNYESLILFFNFLLNIKNQYNSKFKITFIFTEPYNYKRKEYLEKLISVLLVNYSHKFYSFFNFKQLIIKNTIDHKIFKDNAILY